MKTAKLIKTALISGIALAILNSCGGGGGNPLSWLLDKEWQGVEKIDYSNSNAAFLGNLAVNNKGDIVVSWTQKDDSNKPKVWLRKYNGDSWSDPDSDMKTNSASCTSSIASIDDNKEIIATWLELVGTKHIPIANNFYANSWHSVFPIYRNNNNSSSVKMATNNKKTIAIWTQEVSSNYTVIGRIYNHNNTHSWGPSHLISNSSHTSLAPVISIDSNNRAVIAWLQENSSGKFDLYAGVYNVNNGSVISAPHAIESLSGYSLSPSIASDSSGNSIIVWEQGGLFSHRTVYACKFDGTWSSPVRIDNSNKEDLQVTIKYNKLRDEFVALWAQKNSDDNYAIYFNTYKNGSWQGENALEKHSEATGSFEPKIAFDSEGNAVAIWLKENSSGKLDLVAKSYDGSDWGETKVIDNLSSNVNQHYIAFDGDDDAVVVWRQKDNSGRVSIFANYLE